MVEDLSWFRKDDNDPFIIAGTAINQTTFKRRSADLPGGNYAANGNRALGEQLGYPNTQAVMYSLLGREQYYSGLVSDDVNMLDMGMTGEDRNDGTPEDYELFLFYQADCMSPEPADIAVFFNPGLVGSGNLGVCEADIALSFAQPGPIKIHYSLTPDSSNTRLEIPVNPLMAPNTWDFGSHIYSAGFEPGDVREWGEVIP